MKKYEILIIISNSLGKSEAEKYFSETITSKIKELGGKITFEDFWGERGFAYIIKKQKWGYYGCLQYEMDGDKNKSLRDNLFIDKSVLRFLISTVDKKTPEPKKYKDMKSESDLLSKKEEKTSIKKPLGEKKIEEKIVANKIETKVPIEKPKPTPVKKPTIDKKLDDDFDSIDIS